MSDLLPLDTIDFDDLWSRVGDESKRPRCVKCCKPVDCFFSGVKYDNETEFVAILCHGETKQIERRRRWRARADLMPRKIA